MSLDQSGLLWVEYLDIPMLCFYVGCCGTWARWPPWPAQQGTRPMHFTQVIRIIPLTTLFSRQPTLWLHDLCQEVLTVHGNELRLFGAKAFPPKSYFYCRVSAVDTIFNGIGYDAVWAKHRTYRRIADALRVSHRRRYNVHKTICGINTFDDWFVPKRKIYENLKLKSKT